MSDNGWSFGVLGAAALGDDALDFAVDEALAFAVDDALVFALVVAADDGADDVDDADAGAD